MQSSIDNANTEFELKRKNSIMMFHSKLTQSFGLEGNNNNNNIQNTIINTITII
jgi:hypothetical protein